MLGLGFFNSALLWGLPLAAIPIIIHILNRRRFKQVPWAAMEYLLRALKQNRRRIQMEQWLLLLLRVLAVLLLVFLVTRPQLSGGSLVGVTTHHVVMIDDSASMQQRSGVGTLFSEGIEKVQSLAQNLVETKNGDLFTIVKASAHEKPDELAIVVNAQLPKRVRDKLAGQQCGDGILDLDGLLRSARKLAGSVEKASRTTYYLVTDLRRTDWLAADAKPLTVIQRLAELDNQREQLMVVEVGRVEKSNLAVSAVRCVDRVPVAGAPVTLEIEVHNVGDTSSAPFEVSIEIDGRVSRAMPVDSLTGGAKAVVALQHTFRESGFHGVVASVPNDVLGIDNRRAMSLEVVSTSQVLVVDGDPSSGTDGSETFLLAAALDPSEQQGSLSGITPIVIPEHALSGYDLAGINMIWLCNVPAPSIETAKKIEEFVAAGGGLVIFAGEQVEASRYNEVFYKGGQGLMPLAFVSLKGDNDRPDAAFLADRSHPAMRVLGPELMDLLFSATQIRRYLEMAEDATAPAQVILRIKDSEGSPLLVSRTYKQGGKVYVFGTTANNAWSTILNRETGVPLVQEIHKDAVKVHDQSAYNLDSGGRFLMPVNPGVFKPDVMVRLVAEDGVERTFTADPVKGGEEAGRLLDLPMAELRGQGLFEIQLQPHRGALEKRLLARNAPPIESRLAKLGADEFRRVYPDLGDRVTVIPNAANRTEMLAGHSGEIWRVLALALLAALVIETLLAWRFGRR